MHYSLIAFIPLLILAVIAALGSGIALWPGKSRLTVSPGTVPAQKPRHSAEILYFPVRPAQITAMRMPDLRQQNR